MTEPTDPGDIPRMSEFTDVTATWSDDKRFTVEFRVEDLVRQLQPDADLASHCAGCIGCMGCSM